MTDFTTITACGECCVGCSKKINGECPGCIDILQDCYVEEDLFPMIFTEYEERDYGILFYNTENKDSFDSNHAVIYKDRIHDIPKVLKDIAEFYKAKGSRPIIYQSMLDDNWFDVIKDELTAAGYKSWIEDQEYMIQSDRNRIIPNPEIEVRMISEWNDEIENVFIEAEEPWEIMVAKKTLAYPKAWMFAASLNGKIIQKIDEIDEIWAVGRNEKKLEELREKYSSIRPVIADFSTDGVEVIKQKIQKELRANIDDVRFLINNAGIGYMGHFDKQGTEDIEKLCKINCSAPAALMSLCIPYMKRGAKIINVSSASSFQPNPYLSMYSASKVFLKNLSRAVNVELKSRGITVTCVCPGWIDTEMLPDEKDGEKIHYTGKISAEKVVKKAMRDCLKGKDISTPGAFASYFRIYSKYTPTKIVMKQWVKAIRRYVA